VIQVHPLSEVRQRLSGILARFRREGAAAEPVAFGSPRKPEAILLPYEVYTLDWQHLDAARNVEASAAIMRGDLEPMRKMLDALVRDGTPAGRRHR
jgi:uncharacterized protein